MKSYIDEKLENVKVSNKLKNEILQKAVMSDREEQPTMTNRKYKILIPVMCIIAVMAVGISATAAIKHYFESKGVEQSIEGNTAIVSVDPSVQEPDSNIPGYVIFIDSELFTSEKANGVEKITAKANPEAYMTISHVGKQSADGYISDLKASLTQEILADDITIGKNSPGIKYTTGYEWDDIVTTVYAVDDGKGGCFIIKYEHIVEATEGFGARFQTMANTFEVIAE